MYNCIYNRVGSLVIVLTYHIAKIFAIIGLVTLITGLLDLFLSCPCFTTVHEFDKDQEVILSLSIYIYIYDIEFSFHRLYVLCIYAGVCVFGLFLYNII